MDDLDFSHLSSTTPAPVTPPPASSASMPFPSGALPTDAQLAARFFATAGDEASLEAGSSIFVEGEKPGSGLFSKKARMYLLREGQVALTLKGKPLHLVLPGEVFGELAIISDAPRSATATALKASRVASMDEKRVLQALPRTPEFALQLVSSLTSQMRRGVERLLAARRAIRPRAGGTGLDAEQIGKLRRTLGDPSPTLMRREDKVVNQGASGGFMFVLVEGITTISVNGSVVEQVGPGESFGEAALLGSTTRAAGAVAETDGAWLPVNREAFLKIAREHPAICLALLHSMCERVRHINGQLG